MLLRPIPEREPERLPERGNKNHSNIIIPPNALSNPQSSCLQSDATRSTPRGPSSSF